MTETPLPFPGPDGLPPLLDAGNVLLGKVASNMVVGKVPTPDGERGVLTIRTPDVTLTLLMDKAEAAQWADSLAMLRDTLSGAGLLIPARGPAMRIAGAARNAGKDGSR
jgi:hypothetical protein